MTTSKQFSSLVPAFLGAMIWRNGPQQANFMIFLRSSTRLLVCMDVMMFPWIQWRCDLCIIMFASLSCKSRTKVMDCGLSCY
jgi:hypothetical protein